MVADHFLRYHLHHLRDFQLFDEQVLFVSESEMILCTQNAQNYMKRKATPPFVARRTRRTI